MRGIRPAPLHLVLGLVIWSLWFVLLYGGLSLACEFAPPLAGEEGAWTWLNVLMSVLALLVTGALLYASYRCSRAGFESAAGIADSTRAFIRKLSLSVYLVSAAGALALAVPGLILPPCI